MKKVVSLTLTLIMITAFMVGCGKKVNFEENVVAMVDDKEIMLDEVTVYLRELESLFEMQYGPNIWDQADQDGKKVTELVKEMAVDSAIRGYIMEQKAAKEGIELSEEELTEIDDNVKQYFEYADPAKIEDNNITEDMIKKIFTANKYNQKLMEAEMKDFTVDKEKVLEDIGEDLNYKKYAVIQEFGYEGASEQVRARHILISTLDESNNPLPEEEKAKAKEKAEDILAKAKAGEDFAALAKEYSEDPGSKDNGGEYTFTRGRMVDEFEDTAFNLEIGEISDLVETNYGYHIIKVEEKTPGTEEDIQELKDYEKSVEDQMSEYQKQTSFEEIYNTWKDEYDIEINKDLLKSIKVQQSRNNIQPNEVETEENQTTEENTDENAEDDTEAEDNVEAEETE